LQQNSQKPQKPQTTFTRVFGSQRFPTHDLPKTPNEEVMMTTHSYKFDPERSLFALSQAALIAVEAIYQELGPKARRGVFTRLLAMEEVIASEPTKNPDFAADVAEHLHFIVKSLAPSTRGDEISELSPKRKKHRSI
jgi:hypothetical protein